MCEPQQKFMTQRILTKRIILLLCCQQINCKHVGYDRYIVCHKDLTRGFILATVHHSHLHVWLVCTAMDLCTWHEWSTVNNKVKLKGVGVVPRRTDYSRPRSIPCQCHHGQVKMLWFTSDVPNCGSLDADVRCAVSPVPQNMLKSEFYKYPITVPGCNF